MKILITGANGMLAKSVRKRLANGNELMCTDVNELDITNEEAVIKKVEEDDDWFYLKLRFPKIDGFLCQKNLITEGTIEEFEEIFKDKLVRKTMKTTKKNP